MILWSRFIYLFARIVNSQHSRLFPKRNIYSGGRITRTVVKFLWFFKTRRVLRRVFPLYESLFFFPFFMDKGRLKGDNRIFLYDALIFRNCALAKLVHQVRKSDVEEYALVTSWDNPFYGQLCTKSRGYICWSVAMKNDIEHVHDFSMANRKLLYYGAFPFQKFQLTRRRKSLKTLSSPVVLGYACSFCDDVQMYEELELLNTISEEIAKSGLEFQILLRGYPSIPRQKYLEADLHENITLYHAKDTSYIDRFGDGRERIMFSTDEERHFYLAQCDFFLSLATSFSIEAAIDNVPIIHIYYPKWERQTKSENQVFTKIDLSDHIRAYFESTLTTVSSPQDLVNCLEKTIYIEEEYAKLQKHNQTLLSRFGFDLLN